MFTTDQTGQLGEQAAAEALRRAGYMLCDRNWRSGHYELDIVALRRDTLHFVEVKTRRAGSLTPPEAAITAAKFRSLRRAAEHYLALHAWEGEVQFDLASVTLDEAGHTEVELIENAMECHW